MSFVPQIVAMACTDAPDDLPFRFWLGTHHPHWLRLVDVPLFVSRRRLVEYRSAPAALGEWALDSGGFSELSLFGRWTVTPRQYIGEVCRWLDRPGKLLWAAAQDWMCEPPILAKTGGTVREHQARTVANYLELADRCPEVPWLPVLQGWHFDDYLACADLYAAAGVDLAALPLVGLGSVCRRQDTSLAEEVIREMHGRGVRLHAFGFKVAGLRRCGRWLASADSMAWSFQARKRPPLPGCEHANCANCLRYALLWRERVLGVVGAAEQGERQLTLF